MEVNKSSKKLLETLRLRSFVVCISNLEGMIKPTRTEVFELVEKLKNQKGQPDNLLLPMAFVEGSPMHASYGAGHATVAGACVTILKAFFNHELYLNYEKTSNSKIALVLSDTPDKEAFESSPDGSKLVNVKSKGLTVEGELNKVAANISIGRDWAGVHYYSDYVQSMILGEEIAIGILQEQSLTYLPDEDLSMTLPKFDGSVVQIKNGKVLPI